LYLSHRRSIVQERQNIVCFPLLLSLARALSRPSVSPCSALCVGGTAVNIALVISISPALVSPPSPLILHFGQLFILTPATLCMMVSRPLDPFFSHLRSLRLRCDKALFARFLIDAPCGVSAASREHTSLSRSERGPCSNPSGPHQGRRMVLWK
jgi:hypothetical protein